MDPNLIRAMGAFLHSTLVKAVMVAAVVEVILAAFSILHVYCFFFFFLSNMCIASGLPKGSRGMVQEIKQALGWCNNHFDISYCYLIVFVLWCRLQSVQLLM